jgi:uncharacterized protein HemX
MIGNGHQPTECATAPAQSGLLPISSNSKHQPTLTVKIVIAAALALMGSSAAGVYSLVAQADHIAKLPAAVEKITHVLAGDADQFGKRRPGLIERFESQSEQMTKAVEALTKTVETLGRRMDSLERQIVHTVPNER